VFDRIDHIGVAVEEIEPALELWRDRLELHVGHREISEEQGVEAVLLDLGSDHIELMAPLAADTPVGKFLAKRGPGLHHVAYTVPDIQTTLAALEGAGLRLIDKSPRAGLRETRVAFIHPKAIGGVLIEVVELPAGQEDH
jgi:methylmalonyl-CoA/ethylmalonyl-CoA epimerase